jgi:hypothetical protein
MTYPIAISYGLFVAAALASWRRWPAGYAAPAVLLGGALILPTTILTEGDHVEFPFWVTPACLISPHRLTKASVAAAACLAGLVMFDRRRILSLGRPVPCDFLVAAWCVYPIVHIVANRTPAAEAMADAGYQTLTWGIPYLVGRAMCGSIEGRNRLAFAIIISGIVCVPLAAVEFVAGPFAYASLYGFHPYGEQGVGRYVGSRPLLFFEDGNQLGIWLATSALVACWLRRSARLNSSPTRRGGVVAAVLVVQAIVAQSVGAVALMLSSLASMEVLRRLGRIWPLVAILVLVMLYVVVRATGRVDAKALVQRTAVGRAAIDASIRLGRKSFGWRLKREETHTRIALRRPWFGQGRWDWWRDGPERPWGLPTLVLGQHGMAGLLLLSACLALPIATFLACNPARGWASPTIVASTALAAALLLNVLDALLNGAFFVPVMMAAGGLAEVPERSEG